MKKINKLIIYPILFGISILSFSGCDTKDKDVEYTGNFSAKIVLSLTSSNPKVKKIIACFEDTIEPTSVDKDTFIVNAGFNKATITDAYTCDENGKKTSTKSKYIAIETVASTTTDIMQTKEKTEWVSSYKIAIRLNEGKTIQIGSTNYQVLSVKYNAINDRICDEINGYAKDTFTYNDITLNRSLYTPEGALKDSTKNPLIVWLHGYGEGGTDIEIPMLNSNAVALSSSPIQSYFTSENQNGAYVAFIQTPTMWMDTDGKGNYSINQYTGGGQDSYYTEALSHAIDGLIQDYPDIDSQRIYIAGCSNGGYMTINLAINYKNKYAAYVPICEAYMNGNITNDTITSIKNLNIYFIHSKDDSTVNPYAYTVPTYYRLIEAGAENVEFSFVDGYNHGSWISFFENKANTTFDKEKVKENISTLEYGDQGTLIKKDYYVDPTNCYESLSVFAWLASKSSNII